MSNNTITVRSATSSDWQGIAALLQSHALPLEGAQAHLDHFFLAICDNSVIGSAAMEVYGSDALLRSVAVTSGKQGHGVGQMLVSRIVDAAKQRQISTLYLLTTTAEDYFARIGFQRLSAQAAPPALKQSVEFQGVCPSSAVLMQLTLSS